MGLPLLKSHRLGAVDTEHAQAYASQVVVTEALLDCVYASVGDMPSRSCQLAVRAARAASDAASLLHFTACQAAGEHSWTMPCLT